MGVQRVFLGAQLLGAAADRRAAVTEIGGRSNADIVTDLSADSGYTELGELDAERAEHVGAAYRNDYVSANRYLAEVLENPLLERLSAPVTVVVAADDPDHGGVPRTAPRLGAAGRACRAARARRRRPLFRAYPANPGGTGRAPRSRPVRLLLIGQLKGNRYVVFIHDVMLDVDRQPGKAPILLAEATGDVAGWAAEHRDALRAVVAEHGSVLVRGLGLRDAAEVTAVFRRLANGLMVEREAFASRRVYADGVYSSATWPANQPMCMHHELSYRLEVPSLLLFACLSAPTRGGATAVSDSPTCWTRYPASWSRGSSGMVGCLPAATTTRSGRSVAEAFGTEDRGAVESYCRANGIGFEWQRDGGLRTWQRRSAVVRHPVTGQRCWFNQIAFLNEWTIDPEVREYLVDMYGADGLPFNTRFGNGDPIGEDVVQLLNQVYEDNTVREPWQAGDLMLVDNIRTAHSREAYEGAREILVGMAEPVRVSDCVAQ